jgi:hypothetical protein
MSMPILGWGGRWNGQTGGEIPPVYRNEGKRWCELLPGLTLFRLVAPSLLPRVVGPYLVCGVWFPSCLLL